MINALRKRLESYVDENKPTRLLIGGLPDFVLKQIAAGWQSEVELFIITSDTLTNLPGNAQVRRADDLTMERWGSWVALVTSGESRAIVESVRSSGAGTVVEAWRAGFPWISCSLPGLRWEDILETWIQDIGLGEEMEAVSSCVKQLRDELGGKVDAARVFFDMLNAIPSAGMSYGEICFRLGIPRHMFGQTLRKSGDTSSVLAVLDTFVEAFRINVAEEECNELCDVAQVIYSENQAKTDEVKLALRHFANSFKRLAPEDTEIGVLAWRSVFLDSRKNWSALDYATLADLVGELRVRSRFSFKLGNGQGIQLSEISDNRIIIRDRNASSPSLEVELTFPEHVLEDARNSADIGKPWKLFPSINNRVSGVLSPVFPADSGPHKYALKLPREGKQAIKFFAGPDEYTNKASSSAVTVWECCAEFPLVVTCAESKLRAAKRKKRRDEEGNILYEVNQEITLPSPGPVSLHIFICDLDGQLKVMLPGGNETNPVENLIPIENSPCQSGLLPSLEIFEGADVRFEWTDKSSINYRAVIDFNFKEEGEEKVDSLAEAIVQAHAGRKARQVTNVLDLALTKKLNPDQVPTSESVRAIAALEGLQQDIQQGWKPFLLSLGEDLRNQVRESRLAHKQYLSFSGSLDLNEEANVWRNVIFDDADWGDMPAPLHSYVCARGDILNSLRGQFNLGPGIKMETRQLARKAYVGGLDRKTLERYLEAFLVLIEQAKNGSLSPPWQWYPWAVDSVLLFEEQTTGPIAGLLGPFHPITLSRLFFLQECLGERLRENSRSSLAVYFSRAQALSLGHLPDAQLKPSRSISFPSGDHHWLLVYRQKHESQLPPDSMIQWLLNAGLDPKIGPAGVDEQVLPETISQYLYAYPTRQSVRLLLEDCSQKSFPVLRDALVEDDTPTELGKRIPDGISVFDPFTKVLKDENGETLAYDPDLPICWYHASPPAELPIDIETLPRSTRVDFVSSDHGGVCSLAMPVWRKHIVRADKTGQLETGITLPDYGCDSGLERTCITVIKEFEPRGEQLAWGTRISSGASQRANWTLCTASHVDPRLFIEHVSSNPGKALWTYRLFGSSIGGQTEFSQGHFLIAKVSTALINSLRNLLTSAGLITPVNDLLRELARSGLTLGDEFLRTGRKAEGALGQFLVQRIVWQPAGQMAALPHWELNSAGKLESAGFLIQVDPFADLLRSLWQDVAGETRTDSIDRRGDIISFHVKYCGKTLWIKPVVIEAKFSTGGQLNIADALDQARATASHIDHLLEFCIHDENSSLPSYWSQPERMLLAELIHLGLRLSAGSFNGSKEDWHEFEAKVLTEILSGSFRRFDAIPIVIAHYSGNSVNNLETTEPHALIPFEDAQKYPSGEYTEAYNSVQKSLACLLRVSCENEEPVLKTKVEAGTIEEGMVTITEVTMPERIPVDITSTEEAMVPAVVAKGIDESKARKEALAIAYAAFNSTFEDFIGNQQAILKLRDELVYALLEDPPQLATAFLFTGNPSTGKTTLSKKIASLIKAPFVHLVGTNITSPEFLVEQIDKALKAAQIEPVKLPVSEQGIPEYEYPPMVIFIDEVHLVKGRNQEGLLTLTEPRERYLRLKDRICRFPSATFIGATTRDSELDRALRSRFGNPIHLSDYNVSEVARILYVKNPTWQRWPDEIREGIARLARSIPREAERLAKRLERKLEVSLEEITLEDALEKLRVEEGLDRNGLDMLSWETLRTLAKETKPIGRDLVARRISTADEQKLTDEIIPALQRLALVKQVAGGQVITDKGRNYLRNEKPPLEQKEA